MFAVGNGTEPGARRFTGPYYALYRDTTVTKNTCIMMLAKLLATTHTIARHCPRPKFHPTLTTIKNGRKSFAAAELNRDKTAVETGTITFTNIDPQEGACWNITAGRTSRSETLAGRHACSTSPSVRHTQDTTEPDSGRSRHGTCLTIDAMITRNREASPARIPSTPAAEASSHPKTCRRRRTYRQHSRPPPTR